MRFLKVLTEQTDGLFTVTVDNEEFFDIKQSVIDRINKDCSQIISDYKKSAGRMLFRGIHAKSLRSQTIDDRISKNTPRKNREPKDTPLDLHNMVNDLFFDKFGWKPRSEGVFATGSPSVASYYGDIYIFLPSNGYKYIWSPSHIDLFGSLMHHIEENLPSNKKLELLKKAVDTYKDTDLHNAIVSRCELMFSCDFYYIIEVDDVGLTNLSNTRIEYFGFGR